MPRSLGSEVAAVSVVTRDDIERSDARDLVDVLDMLGTALVEQLGGAGTLASVRIRGADSRDTLVLIDGVPMTDVTSGQTLIQQIPADLIERVEVVRGNMSALYGANATGGVVQIFTRRGMQGPLSGEASIEAGSRGTTAASASIGAGTRTTAIRVAAGTDRTDGFSAADPRTAPHANPDRDGNRRHHAALSFDLSPADGQRISLDLRRIEGDAQYDSTDSFSTPSDTHRQHLAQTVAAVRGQHLLGADWTLAWRWARENETREDSGAGAFGPFSFGNALTNDVVAVQLDGNVATHWRTQMALERLGQSTDLPSYLRQRRDTDVFRAGAVYESGWGALQANVRHDRTNDFGSATTGLVGAYALLGERWRLIANASTSFTPPTLDFLFYDCSPYVCSNPDLQPEKARNLEMGVQWQDAQTLLRATAFEVRYRDKIANDANFVPQNIDRARNRGLELTMRHSSKAWILLAETTWQDPVDEATGERLIRRPHVQLALRADYVRPRWQAGAGMRWVGQRNDASNVSLPAYAVVDLTAHWKLTPSWTLKARVQNLFDRDYAPVFGYNGTPRGVFVGASWSAGH